MFSFDKSGQGASLQGRAASFACGCNISRRGFLGGASALGAAALLPGCAGSGQSPAAAARRASTVVAGLLSGRAG